MMGKSLARKKREKLIREGRRNPADGRGIYILEDLRTRMTKTKAEKVNQCKHKGRLSHYDEDNRPFYFSSWQNILKTNDLGSASKHLYLAESDFLHPIVYFRHQGQDRLPHR